MPETGGRSYDAIRTRVMCTRIAVQEWIESKAPIHILRDHLNHCLPMNGNIPTLAPIWSIWWYLALDVYVCMYGYVYVGGMWGGVAGAIPDMTQHVNSWEEKWVVVLCLLILSQCAWYWYCYAEISMQRIYTSWKSVFGLMWSIVNYPMTATAVTNFLMPSIG